MQDYLNRIRDATGIEFTRCSMGQNEFNNYVNANSDCFNFEYFNINDDTIYCCCVDRNKVILLVSVSNITHSVNNRLTLDYIDNNETIRDNIFNTALHEQIFRVGTSAINNGLEIRYIIPLLSLINADIGIFPIIVAGMDENERKRYYEMLENNINMSARNIEDIVAFFRGHVVTIKNNIANQQDNLLLFDSNGSSANDKEVVRMLKIISNNRLNNNGERVRFTFTHLNNERIQGKSSCFLMTFAFLKLLNEQSNKALAFRRRLESLFVGDNCIGKLLVAEKALQLLDPNQNILRIEFRNNNFEVIDNGRIYSFKMIRNRVCDIPIWHVININAINRIKQTLISHRRYRQEHHHGDRIM